MADYYSVLKKAIGGLQENTGSARRAVYQRARNAIVKQLKNYDPPLSPAQITDEQLKLEECIRKVEAEAARESLGLSTPAPQGSTPPTPASAPTPDAGKQPEQGKPGKGKPKPEPTPDTSSSDPAKLKPEGPAAEKMPHKPEGKPARDKKSAEAKDKSAHQKMEAANGKSDSKPAKEAADNKDVFADAEKAAKDLEKSTGESRRQSREQKKQAGAQNKSKEPKLDEAGPGKASKGVKRDKDADWVPGKGRKAQAEGTTQQPKTEEPAAAGPKKPLGGAERPLHASETERPLAGMGEGLRPSRMPQLIVLFVIALLFALGGYVVYSQRDAILSGLDSLMNSSQTQETAPVQEPQSEPPKKNDDRLLDSSLQVAPDAKNVTTLKITGSGEDYKVSSSSSDAGKAVALAPPVVPDSETMQSKPVQTNSVRPAKAIESDVGGVTVALQSILYEEPTETGSSGSATHGRVLWSLDRGNQTGGDTVNAKVMLPERDMNINMKIMPNADSSLPASHLVEIRFELPEGFSGQGIAEVPGVIMKTAEAERGEKLVGAWVKVSDNLFWIALSDQSEDISQNLAWLSEREWIDIPMLYNNQKRAILTFEKGEQGGRVLAQAIKSWQ
ncbi:hypothetical protein [Flexibacterium corallicola]|uniref:hypothetical protein n=1 Tax=Flexibacterium corallicola TaxID=3037259 RepID=UPI00286FA83B|nr:hypothetical protein [Pseudovibrio sp. M1P-2-3]